MARELRFEIDSKTFSASPRKIDRRKLYGWSELAATDSQGAPCSLLSADESGKYIIPLGGTGSVILSGGGEWIDRSQLTRVGADGEPAEEFKSSYGVVNRLEVMESAQDFLDYSITDFYRLEGELEELREAVGDNIFTFLYTYNDSYAPGPAFVMATEEGLFLMTGVKNIFEMLCFGDCETIDDDHDDRLIEDGDEDIDFTFF